MRFVTVGICVIALWLSRAGVARAEENVKQAAAHFQRGVQLYNEADYRGALVEFKRAHAIAPNLQVLYDIAQTYFQLQDYANALTMFETYLAQAPATAAHHAEAQATLETLRMRVARLAITSRPYGVEITVDDEPVGTTPLARPVVVSLGRRKVSATREGFQPATRYVEVAAGEQATVSLTLVETAPAPAAAAATASPAVEKSGGGRAALAAPWVLTVLLGAVWGITGAVALQASADLATARDTYPTTRSNLDGRLATTTNLALTSDVFGGLTVAALITSVAVTAVVLRRGGSPSRASLELRSGVGSVLVHGSF